MPSDLDRYIRQWGMACHLASLTGLLLQIFIPIPYAGLLVPYLVWQQGKTRHPFIDQQGKAAMNFLLSMAVYSIVLAIFSIFLLFSTCMMEISRPNSDFALFNAVCIALAVIAAFFAISQLVMISFAAAKAAQGQTYRYPFTIQFLR